MTARTRAELKSLVQTLEQDGFDRLRTKHKERQAQLYGHDSYAKEIVANLHQSIKERVPVPSAAPWTAAKQLEGILRVSLSFHVEPPPEHREHNRSPAKQRADRAELFYAYLWHQLDRGGRVSSDTRRYQAVAPFAAWWLTYDAFNLPPDEMQQESYRERYWPFGLTVCDPLTISFLAREDGQPNMAARHFDLPYYEIAKRYGGADDSNALYILNSQFPFLRGGRGQEISQTQAYTKTAEVWILDDLNSCCHAIEVKGQYEQLTEDYPNPWGESPLQLVLGGYNADAVSVEDRYESLLEGLFREQKSLDVTDSHYASIALNPPKAVEQLPAEVAARLAAEDTDREILFSDAGITSLMGTLAQLNFPIDPMFREFRTARLLDRDAAKPPPFLTSPDQGVVKYGDVTAQLQAVETSNRVYDAARESFISGIHGICRRVANFIRFGYEGFNVRGAPVAETIRFSAQGRIPAKMALSEYIGKRIEVGPSDFDDADTLEISIIATSQAQKQLDFTLAHQQRELGYATWEDVAATRTEDVTGLKLAVEEELRYQQNAELIDNLQLLSDLEAIVLEGGPDLSQLYLQGMGAAGGPAGAAPGGSPPRQPNSLVTQTTTPPPMQEAAGLQTGGP